MGVSPWEQSQEIDTALECVNVIIHRLEDSRYGKKIFQLFSPQVWTTPLKHGRIVFDRKGIVMQSKKSSVKKNDPPCIVCNPEKARPDEYCPMHLDQLQHLDLQCETLFRFQRLSRGKGHESYHLFLQGDVDPCGKVLATETDLENLFITVLISEDINLEATISEYDFFKIVRTFGDQLQIRIRQEIVHSWYGNARACIEVYRINPEQPQHWDIESRTDYAAAAEEESPDPHFPQGNKNSIH